jgi:deoxycytidylate deaminase
MQFSKQQLKWFDRAAEIAGLSKFDKYHLGCIAVLKNKIIAASPNKLKTHPKQAEFDRFRNFNCTSDLKNMHSLHAEIACLSMIKQDICYKDLELYIVRLRRQGDFGLARPCCACMNFIRQKGIRHIYYSTNSGFVYEQLFSV